MKKILCFFVLFGCNNHGQKLVEHDGNKKEEINIKTDTSSLSTTIINREGEKLYLLEKRDKIEYARTMLKTFTFCNCMFQALKSDSFFHSVDVSNGELATDGVRHTASAIDTIEQVVKLYLLPPDNIVDSGSIAKPNYSSRCLALYNSEFLDSVIKSLDSKIIKSASFPN